jgi:hypothetical protein
LSMVLHKNVAVFIIPFFIYFVLEILLIYESLNQF